LVCAKDSWVRFDSVLVILGILTNWIMPAIFGGIKDGNPVLMLRMLRLLRVARTLRLIFTIHDLWLLVRSLLNSAGTMAYVIGLLGIILYIFACIAVELITLSPAATEGPDLDEEFQSVALEYFGTLSMSMMTLVQFVSFDSIASIYTPLIVRDPTPPLLIGYFTFAFVMVGVVLMNLITAVVVNSALDQASQDKELVRAMQEKAKRKLVGTLKKIFHRIDADGSGSLTMDEIEIMGSEDRAKLISDCQFEPMELFKALDVNGDGVIEIDAFCDSIWQVSHSQVPLEVKRTEKQVVAMRKEIHELRALMSAYHEIFIQRINEGFATEDGRELANVPRASESHQVHVATRAEPPHDRCPPPPQMAQPILWTKQAEESAREWSASTKSTTQRVTPTLEPRAHSERVSSELRALVAQLAALACQAAARVTAEFPSPRTQETPDDAESCAQDGDGFSSGTSSAPQVEQPQQAGLPLAQQRRATPL